MHISGDLGELIAANYCNMCWDKFEDFVDNIGYFEGKVISHNRPFFLYDQEKAQNDVIEYLKTYDLYDELSEIDSDIFEFIEDFGKRSTGILDLYMLAFKLAKEQLDNK